MNDCPNAELRDMLPDLVHDRLDVADRTLVEAHLASCADCRAEVVLLRELRAAFGRTPSFDVAKIAAAIPAYRAPVRRAWVGWRTAAAIMLLVAGGSSVVLMNHSAATPGPVTVLGPAPRVAPVVIDSAPVVASTETGARPPVDVPGAETAPSPGQRPAASAIAQGREFAMAGSLVDLSERELDALLRDIESLDALPTTDVDAAIISPMSPSARTRGTP